MHSPSGAQVAMTHLAAGVDLGKTSCRVALVLGGNTIGTAEIAGTRGLAEPGGVDAARAAVAAVLEVVRREAGLPADAVLDVVAVGAAGWEAAAGLGRSLLAAGLAAREAVLTSDAIISQLGAFTGGHGAVVAIGTGAVAVGLGRNGLVQVDGLGFWLGDIGGGAWVGRLALRRALQARAGRGPATALLAAAQARYGDLADLAATLAAGESVAASTAAFAPDVAAAAAAGDRVALEVLDAAGTALARTTSAAARSAGTNQVAAVGGLAPLLTDRWRAHLPNDLTVVAPAGTALDGALLLSTRSDLPHESHVLRVRPERVAAGTLVDTLATEQVRRDLDDLDQRTPEQLVDVLLAAEATVPAVVAAARDDIAAAVALAERALLAGGRIVYVGAGTPGRLAALDAAEIPPTFGTDPDRVVALLAGGSAASATSFEGAEDRADSGRADVLALHPGPTDLVVGIAASGRTPYVLAALLAARERGAATVAIVNNPGSVIADTADVAIELLTGPEALAGSTRMKAGTAQKIVLSVLSTGAMVRTGKTYGAWMVDVQPSNEKLRRRAQRMLTEATGLSENEALVALEAAGWQAKTALVATLARLDAESARAALAKSDGRARDAVAQLEAELDQDPQ